MNEEVKITVGDVVKYGDVLFPTDMVSSGGPTGNSIDVIDGRIYEMTLQSLDTDIRRIFAEEIEKALLPILERMKQAEERIVWLDNAR